MVAPGYRQLAVPAIVLATTFLAYHLIGGPAVVADGGISAGALAVIRDASGIGVWLALAWLGARSVDLLLRRLALAGQRPAPPPRLLSDLLRGLLFALAAIAIFIFVFDQPATGLIATSSVVIAVVGFALRYIISDVFSGIALNFDHPYRIGDWVETSPGVVGRVTEITWRATRLLTRDGIAIVAPNGLIATGRLVNYSEPEPTFRTSIKLSLDGAVPSERAKRLLLAGAMAATRAYPDLRPDVLVQDCGDDGIHYVVRFWVPNYGEENTCRDVVMSEVLRGLRRGGVVLAMPKRAIALSRDGRADTRRRTALETLVAETELFQAFEPEEQAVLAGRLRERRVERGTVVVREGEPGGSLFLVAEGALDVRLHVLNGNETTVDRMVPGDLFGEISLLTGAPRTASVVAMTDAVLYEMCKDDIHPLLQQRPELGEPLAALMAERQQHNLNRMQALEQAANGAAAPSSEDLLRRLRSFFGLTARS
ncbi:hypothetical protein GCM10011611_21470 [Aliidongia dinghuensis]|uniref:Small-conductance mechanosensitive channel n=1 Tax=Aliidongia dinghuensis TaxID=1867774 RepID=A0A8J3E316_9PROT|nr:mechanosensitive ion channel family protein [Aliidongia dinghuensis]GGF15393.1 hypothetical protein GCM10011611_21470 [Aliidongia dinghuensis]